MIVEPLEVRWLLAAEVEPNDSLADATPIAPDSSEVLTGEILNENDLDVFRLSLEQVRCIWVKPGTSPLPPKVEILDSNGSVKSSQRDTSNTTFVAPANGTYYVRLSADVAAGIMVGDYSSTVNVVDFQGVTEVEPNDALADSNAVKKEQFFRRELGDENEKGFTAHRIIATEERPPHTTTDRVTDLDFRQVDHLPARKTSHRQSPQFELPKLTAKGYPLPSRSYTMIRWLPIKNQKVTLRKRSGYRFDRILSDRPY